MAASGTSSGAPAELPLLVNIGVSGVSGCIAWLFAHPFELLKNRMMLNPTQSMAEVTRQTAKQGFWKGLSGGIARQVVYASCRLGFYDPIKGVIVRDKSGAGVVTPVERAAAGAAAGALASVLSSPVEVCLVLQSKSAERMNVFSAARTVLRDSGVGGFWRGVVPLMTRAAIVGVSQVAMFDQSKTTLWEWDKQYNLHMTKNSNFALASTFTSVFYAFVTMPIEYSRVRMSSQRAGNIRYTGMLQAIRLIAKEEGVLSLYSSFAPYTMRCSVHTIAAFFILDSTKAALKAHWQ